MFTTFSAPPVHCRGSAVSTSWGWWDSWQGGCSCGSCASSGQGKNASFEFSDAAWQMACPSMRHSCGSRGSTDNSTSISGGSSSRQPVVSCVHAFSSSAVLSMCYTVVLQSRVIVYAHEIQTSSVNPDEKRFDSTTWYTFCALVTAYTLFCNIPIPRARG